MNEQEICFLNENGKTFASLQKKSSWESIRCLIHYTDERLVETQFFENFVKKNQIPEVSVLLFVSEEKFSNQKFFKNLKNKIEQIENLFVVFDKFVRQDIKEQIINFYSSKECLVVETDKPFINNSLLVNCNYKVLKLITNNTLKKLFSHEKF